MSDERSPIITFNISTAAIFKLIGLFLLFWFLYIVRDLIVIILIAIFLTLVFEPIINKLHRLGLPRSISIIILYICIFLVFSAAIFLIIPPLIQQLGQLAINFPQYWEKLAGSLQSFRDYSQEYGILNEVQSNLLSIQSAFARSATSIFSLATSIFGNLISFIFILVLTFYFLLNENIIKKIFKQITPTKYQPYLMDLISRIQLRLGMWLRGELILGVIIGLFSLIGFWLVGLKYFLVLALLAGIFELVPYIGPIFAAVPAILFAFLDSPVKGVAVIILCWLIQQLENNLIVPKVMQKTIGLNPIVVILAILTGARLAGFIGIILAVPTAAVLSILVKDFFDNSNLFNNSQDKKV